MKLYVTTWATTRGILLLDASEPEFRGHSKLLYSTIRGVGRRMNTVRIGSDAFYTLREARADALKRFEARHERAQTEHAWTTAAMKELKLGRPVLVHKSPPAVNKCKPF